MELTIEERRFLAEVLDKIQVQGIANVAAVAAIYQKLTAQIDSRTNLAGNGRSAQVVQADGIVIKDER